MSNKITFPELAGLLAEKSGKSRKYCENFLRELFRIISDALVAGESVKIKGLGTFKLSSIEARKSVNVNTGEEFEIPGHSRVSFTPAKEIAEIVNAPFEAFESIELAENLTDAELEGDIVEAAENVVISEDSNISEDVPEETEPEESETEELAVVTEPEQESEELVEVSESELEAEPEPDPDPEQGPEQEPDPVVAETVENVIDIPENVVPVVPSRRRIFGSGFAAGIIFALVVGLIGFSVYRFCNRQPQTETVVHVPDTKVKVKVVAADSDSTKSALDDSATVESVKPVENNVTNDVNMPETKVSDAPVYDMITKTRYLTTMARDHYGNYNLWPYIYEENKSFLGHPDRIRPGTKIVVPPLSKYGVNPNDPKEIAKAKRMGAEIYARYAK